MEVVSITANARGRKAARICPTGLNQGIAAENHSFSFGESDLGILGDPMRGFIAAIPVEDILAWSADLK